MAYGCDQFSIPAGKAYLSPIVDCFSGMPASWAIRMSPTAEMANIMLEDACRRLAEGAMTHSDRGCRYRWPGWLRSRHDNGLAHSMSKKGCSPDNSAMEGFAIHRIRCALAHAMRLDLCNSDIVLN